MERPSDAEVQSASSLSRTQSTDNEKLARSFLDSIDYESIKSLRFVLLTGSEVWTLI